MAKMAKFIFISELFSIFSSGYIKIHACTRARGGRPRRIKARAPSRIWLLDVSSLSFSVRNSSNISANVVATYTVCRRHKRVASWQLKVKEVGLSSMICDRVRGNQAFGHAIHIRVRACIVSMVYFGEFWFFT